MGKTKKAGANSDNNSVRAWRKSMGYSHDDAAEALGLELETFREIEAAPTAPKYIKLAMAALATGITLDDEKPAIGADES